MIDWEQELNAPQKEAVFHTEGPLLVLAGAGSGKTRVIAYRIAYLLHSKTSKPGQVLAVTFTNKAAREMRGRVGGLLGSGMKEMWVGTFHATCTRILRMEAGKIGFTRDFVIMDSDDQERVLKEAARQLEQSDAVAKAGAACGRISEMKSHMVSPGEFRANYARGRLDEQFASLYSKYQELLHTYNAFDFDDLLLGVVRLFRENPEVLERFQRRFRFLLVDEFQDINPPQYEIVKLLAREHQNLCVVGDDYQAIFSWRGADVRYLLDHFEEDFPRAKVVRLEQNYRSGPIILNAANEVIASLSRGKEKRLWSDQPNINPPLCRYQAADETDEARFVGREVERLVSSEGRAFREFAVLYRMNSQSRLFEEVFLSRGIPYRVVGGVRFYERREVKDALALLRISVNPADSISLRRVLGWLGGIGSTTLERADELGLPLWEALQQLAKNGLLKGKGRDSLTKLDEIIRSFHGPWKDLSPAEQLQRLLEGSGYYALLEKEGTLEAQGRVDNLQELLNLAAQYQAEDADASASDFLAYISLYTDLDRAEAQEDVVTLMTVHSAKGLEFSVVFLTGMEEGIFPHWRCTSKSELDEERRLCYVGITRAKHRIYFTWARRRMTFGGVNQTQRSCFLDELPDEMFQDAEGTAGSLSLKAGQGIRHKAWGLGTLLSWEGSGEEAILTVHFATVGKKRLILKYAPISLED
ncbi:MAG: UvrD-helicase domain-containing protein [Coprothermobacterota bacterium]|nr:UvrD-helicase domain-containing protein [Coprothermobacterota bacterium]